MPTFAGCTGEAFVRTPFSDACSLHMPHAERMCACCCCCCWCVVAVVRQRLNYSCLLIPSAGWAAIAASLLSYTVCHRRMFVNAKVRLRSGRQPWLGRKIALEFGNATKQRQGLGEKNAHLTLLHPRWVDALLRGRGG